MAVADRSFFPQEVNFSTRVCLLGLISPMDQPGPLPRRDLALIVVSVHIYVQQAVWSY